MGKRQGVCKLSGTTVSINHPLAIIDFLEVLDFSDLLDVPFFLCVAAKNVQTLVPRFPRPGIRPNLRLNR